MILLIVCKKSLDNHPEKDYIPKMTKEQFELLKPSILNHFWFYDNGFCAKNDLVVNLIFERDIYIQFEQRNNILKCSFVNGKVFINEK